MNVIVIVGSDLTVNSSANLCHISYIKGLLDNGFSVDLLVAGNDTKKDHIGLHEYEKLYLYSYPMQSFYERIRSLIKNRRKVQSNSTANTLVNVSEKSPKSSFLGRFKRFIRYLYGPYEVYISWKRKAMGFKSNKEYDLVISLAFPPVSHFLAHELIRKKHIKTKRWIQIWEDPWCQDLIFVSLRDDKERNRAQQEEKRLLRLADEVLYVSPITLENQKKLFPESADKMKWAPVPTYYIDENIPDMEGINVFGYFGDYSSKIRNLKPFYEAAKRLNTNVNICGYSDNMFESVGNITVRPRISLDELKPIEDETNVLVFLSNLQGGQIPGKIYQYSATNKVILFILDGTEEEKRVIKDYFSKFNRYVFCENTVDDISKAIQSIQNGDFQGVENKCLDCFTPKKIVNQIINGVEE